MFVKYYKPYPVHILMPSKAYKALKTWAHDM